MSTIGVILIAVGAVLLGMVIGAALLGRRLRRWGRIR